MTEESEFERRVRGDLDAIAGAVPDVPAGTRLDQLSRPPARRVPLLAAVAAGALLLAGVVWVANDGDSGSGPTDVADASTTTGPPASSTAPFPTAPSSTTVPAIEARPPSDTGAYRLWLSTETVSSEGSDLIFVVLGPPDDDEILEWYSAVVVDRWDGDEWQPVAEGGSCQDFWHCWGDLGDRGASLVEYRSRRQLLPSGVGYAEYIHLDGLDPGWHRLRQTIDGELATGVFRVVEPGAMPVVPSLAPVDEDALFVEPVLANPAGATLSVEPALAAPDNELGDVATTMRLDRFEGGQWVALLAFDTPGTASEIRLPALAPGPYRVVRSRAPGADLIGNLWVIDGGPNPVACHVLPSLEGLLPEAAAFEGPRPPTTEVRGSFTPGGFRAEWTGADQTIRYSYPVGSVIDLVGERTVTEGPVMLWYQGFGGEPSTVEAWVQLPPCGDRDAVTAGFTVTGGNEQENVALALRLGRELARLENPDFATAPRTGCPGPDAPDPETPNAVHDVWLYCRTSADQESELVRVPTIFSPGDPIEAVIRRSLGDPWNGLESALPVELRGARPEIEIADGLLTIDWDWDFAANPIDNLTTSNVSGRIIDQIAANAFQFGEIDAIDLGDLPLEIDRPFIYTREQWERAQAED